MGEKGKERERTLIWGEIETPFPFNKARNEPWLVQLSSSEAFTKWNCLLFLSSRRYEAEEEGTGTGGLLHNPEEYDELSLVPPLLRSSTGLLLVSRLLQWTGDQFSRE